MLFGLPAFANELTKDLQKACVSEQLRDHKGVSGHSLEASSFTEYCKCESNFIIGKATKEQLSEISQKPNTSPKWLKQIKSNTVLENSAPMHEAERGEIAYSFGQRHDPSSR